MDASPLPFILSTLWTITRYGILNQKATVFKKGKRGKLCQKRGSKTGLCPCVYVFALPQSKSSGSGNMLPIHCQLSIQQQKPRLQPSLFPREQTPHTHPGKSKKLPDWPKT